MATMSPGRFSQPTGIGKPSVFLYCTRYVRPGPVTVGKFYRPVKKLVSMRIDADVLDWFRSQGGRYQTRINTVLRREMDSAHRH